MFPRTGKPVGKLNIKNAIINGKYFDDNKTRVDVNEKIKSIIPNPKYGDWFEISQEGFDYKYIYIYTVTKVYSSGIQEDQWVWGSWINPENYVQLYGWTPELPNVLEIEMVKDIWNNHIYASKFGFIFVEVPQEENFPIYEFYLSIDEYRNEICLKEIFGE